MERMRLGCAPTWATIFTAPTLAASAAATGPVVVADLLDLVTESGVELSVDGDERVVRSRAGYTLEGGEPSGFTAR